jgi:DNA topoisomerase IB
VGKEVKSGIFDVGPTPEICDPLSFDWVRSATLGWGVAKAQQYRGRRKQALEAVRAAADELSNTPAICRKSYVHDTIVTAFEDGILERFAATMKGYRSQSKREQLLAQVVSAAAAA